VERRAGAEGNAVQQSTRRAQDRESVSQALDRIRRAARQRKKEKFTALLHHISAQHLEAAFFELKENAAPGVDGLTWRAYEAGLDYNIADLHAAPSRSVSGPAVPTGLHTEAGRRPAAATRGCCP
jgi:RNA-directed DNA polymerase